MQKDRVAQNTHHGGHYHNKTEPTRSNGRAVLNALYKDLILALYPKRGTKQVIKYKTATISLEQVVMYHKQLCQLIKRVKQELKLKTLIILLKTPVGTVAINCTRQQRSFLRKKYRVELETDKVWIIKARKFRRALGANGR